MIMLSIFYYIVTNLKKKIRKRWLIDLLAT